MNHESSLLKLDQATRMLAEIHSVDDAVDVIDLAEAARIYARQAGLGLEAQNHAAEIKIRAQRKAGEILRKMEKNKGDQGKIHEHLTGGCSLQPPDEPKTYAEMGIEKRPAHVWQTLATMPPEHFDATIDDIKRRELELTTAALYRQAKIEVNRNTQRRST